MDGFCPPSCFGRIDITKGCIYLVCCEALTYLWIQHHTPQPTIKRFPRSEWKLPLRGRITYRHCRQPKLPSFLYSSIRLFGGGAADAGTAAPTFSIRVPAISKPITLTVESLWTAPTETAKHHILAIDEAS